MRLDVMNGRDELLLPEEAINVLLKGHCYIPKISVHKKLEYCYIMYLLDHINTVMDCCHMCLVRVSWSSANHCG